jgi:hypothetical protein
MIVSQVGSAVLDAARHAGRQCMTTVAQGWPGPFGDAQTLAGYPDM